jgi:hypothetical protein
VKISTHCLRSLGALEALTRCNERTGKRFFSRWEIGWIVYAHYQGVHLATMRTLTAAGFVKAEVSEAVDLVERRDCRCGCDRWSILPAGRQELAAKNVKVPVFPQRETDEERANRLESFRQMFTGDGEGGES